MLRQEKISTSHCFVLVLRGKVEVQTSQGKSVTTHAGEMLFMPRDTYLISDFITDDDSIELYLVFIDHDIVNSFLSSKIDSHKERSNSPPIICKLQVNNTIKQYFNAIKDVYSDIENSKELLRLKIFEFLHLIYSSNRQDLVDTLFSSEQHKKTRSITSLMLENYDKNLTVTDFANLSGRSVSSFNRDFKRKYDQTPKQWLIEQKMRKADKLLADGSNVTECAMEVGYSNVSHFIKAYKLIHGKTPKEMKNIHL